MGASTLDLSIPKFLAVALLIHWEDTGIPAFAEVDNFL